MLYNFKGSEVIRVTVEGQELCLAPGEQVKIEKPNDYIKQLVDQKLLEEVKPAEAK